MRQRGILKAIIFFISFFFFSVSLVRAADESYIQTLSGKIKKKDTCTVIDDKFLNLPLAKWNQVQNLSVDNIISFELRQDTAFFFHNKSFTVTLNVDINYFTSRDQTKPTEIKNVNLVIKYDTTTGAYYPVSATYKFKNAYKVKLTVNSISSPEWGKDLPDIFRIKNQILVSRIYPFSPVLNNQTGVKLWNGTAPAYFPLRSAYSFSMLGLSTFNFNPPVDDKLLIEWSPADFSNGNSVEYDVEWTYIDKLSSKGTEIAATETGAGSEQFNIPDIKIVDWMRNDNSRVTVKLPPYTINLPYTDGYVLVRIRGVGYQNGVRITTPWSYKISVGSIINRCYVVSDHNSNLNWQYTGSFAEDGKRKEVISYFDGTLRSRQAVTLTNTEDKAIVAETIYDNMGRPAMSILPAPINNNKLEFYLGINKNSSGVPYSHTDINGNTCVVSADGLHTSSGASKYYSPANDFKGDANYYFTKYVPDAQGKPFSVTQYMTDNTGRIRTQGGVGPEFQIGSGHDTKYFYSKPFQKDLDRLFGVEVGHHSHYLKNMVIDPNGQASVSYIDANGRTIATALAGAAPERLDPLASNGSQAITHFNEELIAPSGFIANAGELMMQSSAVFTAATSGQFKVNFTVDPSSLLTQHGANNSLQFCSNCYYDLLVEVKDDCGTPKASKSTTAFQVDDVSCNPNAAAFSDFIEFNLDKVGEYSVTYTLRLSEDVIKNQTDYYIANNSNLTQLQTFFEDELIQADLSGCYNECTTCKEKLGTLAQFTDKMNSLLLKLRNEKYSSFPNFNINSSTVQNWITNTYDQLYANCQAIAVNCLPASPCEQKLEMMKHDVIPGGQYALYSYDEGTGVYAYLERQISVLRFFNDPSATEIYYKAFEDDNGNNVIIGSLTESEFIRQYIKHPEWADVFVKKHVEYCSYEWCKDVSAPTPSKNNEVSYQFDESLKGITKGEDAVTKGYFTVAPDALVYSDPFFNGGRGNNGAFNYRAMMQNDLANLSDVLHMTLKDAQGNPLATKNILQLIDWILYCKPTSEAATEQDWINSWNCTPATTCRSVTREWELYREYYLQLKTKYMEQAKRDVMPACTNCFVGKDILFATNPNLVPTSNSVGPCPPNSEFVEELGPVVPFDQSVPPAYIYQGNTQDVYFSHPSGNVTRPVSVSVTETTVTFNNLTFASSTSSITRTVTINPGENKVLAGTRRNQHTAYPNYDVTHTTTVTIDFNSINCPTYSPPPSSTCVDDPNYVLYTGKIRVFDEYVNQEAYLAQLANNNQPSSSAEAETMKAASIAALRQQAIENLTSLKQNWKDRLKAVRDEENQLDIDNNQPARFSSITDATIDNLVNNLALVAQKYIEIAPKDNIRPASTLPHVSDGSPATIFASNGHNNFTQVFSAIIGTSLMSKGFGPELIDNPYPYNKTPIQANYNVGEITPEITARIGALQSLSGTTNNPAQFHTYLQQQLGSDYILTFDELQDLITRGQNNCRYLKESLLLPAAFIKTPLNDGASWTSCGDIAGFESNFNSAYPDVALDSKLYRVLLKNYMNFKLGFSLSYYEYANFGEQCTTNGSALLFNKPATPLIQNDEFGCAADVVASVFDNAGQEYERYIEIERRDFRNRYVAKCLSNSAAAKVEGDQYEYHYTLYYYDQSGNLVKTIPPEGVTLLTDAELELVEAFRNDNQVCDGTNIPTTENKIQTLTNFSTSLQNFSAKGVEMWMYSTNDNRQVRFVTPDQKYLYQAAIANKKLWVEMYALQAGTGEVSIVKSNEAVADISSLAIQDWSHLFVQSSGALIGSAGNPPNTSLTLNGQFQETGRVNNITNNFTMELWVRPSSTHQVDGQTTSGYSGLSGQKYVIMPFWGGTAASGLAGAGISVGTNGVSVYEHADNYIPGPLTWSGSVNGWTHVAVVYQNRTPSLYINGVFIKTGLTSIKPNVFPSLLTLGGQYGTMDGSVDEVRIWNYSRTEQQIAADMNNRLTGNETGLSAYWRVNQEDGQSLPDHSGHGYNVALPSGYTAANWSTDAPNLAGTNQPPVANGNLDLYLDGKKLTNLPLASMPSYPFDWEINSTTGGFTVPADDIASLKHMRVYNDEAEPEEIYANYKNSCLAPVDRLAIQSTPLMIWGRFNIPAPGGPTTTGPGSTVEKVNRFIVPDHYMPTNYAYNSLNQVIKQSSPDGGTSNFWYDRLSRLAVSQNEEQKTPYEADTENPANRYSYTKYDDLGRITEVGEKLSAANMTEDLARDNTNLQNWLNSGSNRQVTVTAYDAAPTWAPSALAGKQFNLRKRVAASALLSAGSDPAANRTAASYYSYDMVGNVSELVQENAALVAKEAGYINGGTGLKSIKYQYDLASGKVNKVLYQDGKWDQFYYQYLYDDNNRVVQALSSRVNYGNRDLWIKEATYRYYLHGPLARMELGKNKVQGLDYAYTLQGWLKGVNSQVLDHNKDMSGDGKQGSAFQNVARDVIAFSLGYHENEYTQIDNTAPNSFGIKLGTVNVQSTLSGKELFNGNIGNATYAISKLENGAPVGYTYRYDQLNRLTVMDRHNINPAAPTWGGDVNETNKERITYDANGNIQTYLRNGAAGNLPMDDMTYGYNLLNGRKVNNKLRHVKDAISTSLTEDIENQQDDNYVYDKIGNLVKDNDNTGGNKIEKITWTVYGKIGSIVKNNGNTVITYSYDAGGNRITKKVQIGTDITNTYYLRDATGNVMGVYQDKNAGQAGYKWMEQHLYGSGRLGIAKSNFFIASGQTLGNENYVAVNDPMDNGIEGLRNYELSNHLGNVLTVVSDKIIGDNDASGFYYKADVVSASDYAPFGMQMIGRKWNSGNYRYGFNGKENDNEVKGEGNQQDYGMRIYDPRIGKFLSVDPISKKYPELTPYQFASNRVIDGIDLDGLEYVKFTENPIGWIASFGEGWSKGEGAAYEMADNFNRNLNPIGIVTHGSYSTITGKDLLTKQSVDRSTAFTSMAANVIMLAAGAKFAPIKLTPQLQMEKQLATNAMRIGNSMPNQPALYLSNAEKEQIKAYVKQAASNSVDEGFDILKLRSALIHPATKQTMFVYGGEEIGYYKYTLEKGVELSLNIPKQYQNKGLGSFIFNTAVKATNATKFTATWVRNKIYEETGSSINLTKYLEARAKGLSKEQAAFETWSGDQARQHGFKNVVVEEIENGVRATFTK